MPALMVLGCSSDAGKSLLATALCRWFARQGVDVVPFKGQNMSNNARVVRRRIDDAGLGEIGVAQWLQAGAAGVVPDTRMNPVLIKPEGDTRSQVVVDGVVDPAVGALPWTDRHDHLWAAMTSAYDELAAAHELVVIEGAGSPAEINLRDQVNNRIVEYADAAAVLVADIDRGGAFAHLYGTWSLVPEPTRRRLRAFVLNKFRGDAALLPPGPQRLVELTGMESLGVLPMLSHALPREEGALAASAGGRARAVIVAYPFASNLDEFQRWVSSTSVAYAREAVAIDEADVVVLPGSKNVRADLAWMIDSGIADAVQGAVGRGVQVIGVCGGAMMLGRSVADPAGIEGSAGTSAALDVLALDTRLHPTKRLTAATASFRSPADGMVAPLDGLHVDAYEIRNGELHGELPPCAWVDGSAVAWASGTVLATTLHGLFESPDFVERLVGAPTTDAFVSLDATFDQLADAVDQHLDGAVLDRLAGGVLR